MTTPRKPTVAVIGTGGTIASVGGDGLELVRYIDRKQMLPIDDLLVRTPELAQVADVTPIAYDVLQSHAIGPGDWLALTSRIHALVAQRPELDGIVITHGTATLEETAYFLNLALEVDVPVVLVGAQRPATAVSGDGPLNLVNGVRTAGAPAARGMGVMIVLNDEIQAAREGTKTSTLRLQTFRSPDFGALGHVDADRVAFYPGAAAPARPGHRIRREQSRRTAPSRCRPRLRGRGRRRGQGLYRRRCPWHRRGGIRPGPRAARAARSV